MGCFAAKAWYNRHSFMTGNSPMRKPILTLLALTTLTIAASTPALAENAKGFADETRDNGQINLRYPGDKGYTFGTTQRGPNGEEQPYVEKCFWTAENGWFGGFTQTCQRHTLDNTSDQ
jgi:hypothetical protein